MGPSTGVAEKKGYHDLNYSHGVVKKHRRRRLGRLSARAIKWFAEMDLSCEDPRPILHAAVPNGPIIVRSRKNPKATPISHQEMAVSRQVSRILIILERRVTWGVPSFSARPFSSFQQQPCSCFSPSCDFLLSNLLCFGRS
jgi:hypothetical protein